MRRIVSLFVIVLSSASVARAEDFSFATGWQKLLHPWSSVQRREDGELRTERGAGLRKEVEASEIEFEWAWEDQTDVKDRDEHLVIEIADPAQPYLRIQITLPCSGPAKIRGHREGPDIIDTRSYGPGPGRGEFNSVKEQSAEKVQSPRAKVESLEICAVEYHRVRIIMTGDKISIILDGKDVAESEKYGEIVRLAKKRVTLSSRLTTGEDSVCYASYFRNCSAR